MIWSRISLGNTPLIVRVVCLYVFAAVPVWVTAHINPAPPLAAVQVPVAYRPVTKLAIQGQPTKLKIDRLGIDLPIIFGKYDAANDSWTVRDDAVQYASVSTLPNDESGNTFLYGHNTSKVLDAVKDLRVGDKLTITTSNGRIFTYSYNKDVSVKPNKTDVITAPSDAPRVTLMTCEGIFSQMRRLMYFNFEGVT